MHQGHQRHRDLQEPGGAAGVDDHRRCRAVNDAAKAQGRHIGLGGGGGHLIQEEEDDLEGEASGRAQDKPYTHVMHPMHGPTQVIREVEVQCNGKLTQCGIR
jgi:hypothetical protein